MNDFLNEFREEPVPLPVDISLPAGLSSPLYHQYDPDLTEEENKRVTAWRTHWNVYGRGVTMYRTNELYELIFQGIPKSLREELWFVFSGAIHDVRHSQYLSFVIFQNHF